MIPLLSEEADKATKYELNSICNDIESINRNKSFIFISFRITFPKRSVTRLYNCDTAVIQLISNLTQAAFKREY